MLTRKLHCFSKLLQGLHKALRGRLQSFFKVRARPSQGVYNVV